MNPPDSTIDVANFISDVRAALDKHIEEAARSFHRLTSPPGEISPATQTDKMWVAILAFHTALVDWVIANEIRDDKRKASATVDVGLRLFLDHVREQFIAAEAEKRKPKPNVIGLRQ
jgi:hypothetical protein